MRATVGAGDLQYEKRNAGRPGTELECPRSSGDSDNMMNRPI